MSQPIILYSHASGPNPWKVAIILEELGLKYETKYLEFPHGVKAKEYTAKNPNGRVPCIEDPNTGITIWESGAIIEYLIDNYDKSGKLSYSSFPEKYHLKQWLFFQVSGQGPYFGQGAWFNAFHPEKLPSVIERYAKEIERVTMVLNTALEGKDYLVGDKCTYADLSFVTWYAIADFASGPHKIDWEAYPNYKAWMDRLNSRPAVKKVMEEKAKVNAK